MHIAAQARSKAAHHSVGSFVGNPNEDDPVWLGPSGGVYAANDLRMANRVASSRVP
jgi:hypothetical protein